MLDNGVNKTAQTLFSDTSYDRSACQVGVVHIGFGAFHRAHQAVYIDDFMQASADLRWGIATVNLRSADKPHFDMAMQDITRNDGYFLKSYSADGDITLRRVRSHIAFSDWSSEEAEAEAMIAEETVKLVTITVTESGYYTDSNGDLALTNPAIEAEISSGAKQTIYGYLRAGLTLRKHTIDAPVTIACCDNIRQNGKMLQRNLLAYLEACGDLSLRDWVVKNVAFPCSMVDRITPRSPSELAAELSDTLDRHISAPVMAEDFIQWVLQDTTKSDLPNLAEVGVTVTTNVDPYEETKIRVLNGGHTALVYMAALMGIDTFDAAMRDPDLLEHFHGFETQEVLPAITIDLPFSKESYLQKIEQRFGNQAIGDTVARISADGMAKFSIFILPTIEGCLSQGITPHFAIRSIASWHQFARHCAAGNIPFDYNEPSWDVLEPMLGTEEFITSPQLWGNVAETYPIFADILRQEIAEMEMKWPV